MAQFDIKNARIYIRDGYSVAGGAVDNVSGYTVGATTMIVEGFATPLVTGDIFVITGDASKTKYRITAHTETLGATTSITFTPGLVAATVADAAVLTIQPHEIEVKIGEGNITYSEKKARTYVKDRGKLSTVRNGDEEPVDVRMDAQWEWIKASTGATPTIEDVLKKRGVASTWVSSSSDPCEPYCVDIVIEYKPDCGNEEIEIISLPDFRYEEIPHDSKAGTLAIQGKCNVVEASVARVAA